MYIFGYVYFGSKIRIDLLFVFSILCLVPSHTSREQDYCFICNRDVNCVMKHVVILIIRWSKKERLLDQDVLTL